MKQIGCYIKLGTMLQGLITIVTLGNGYQIAYWIANKLGYEDCGCAEREDYLNGLTCKEIREMRKRIERMKNEDKFTYKHQ